MFQLLFSVAVLVVNLYCILAGVFVKDLHALDFYLPLLQSFFDFFITGCCSTVFNAIVALYYLMDTCVPFCDTDLQQQRQTQFHHR